MQQENTLSLCEQARHLAKAYHHLQEALSELSQTGLCWNKEVDEYLRDHSYAGRTASQFMLDMVEALEPMQQPMQDLALDHVNLCTGLSRVERGELFSV